MSETDHQLVVPIPLFLQKLWKMVNDTDAEDIICWNSAGDGFIICDQLKFITELLPLYFKHNHLSSFIRQLNFYGFHKVSNSLKNELEFAHPYFLKDLPETLGFITRKCPNVKSKTSVDKTEEFHEVLSGVKELKTKHHIVENELQLLKQENAALWNEINSLRMKYSRQTKIINKLIHFLITYIHSHPNSFSKQGTSVMKNRSMNLQHSPQLLQIDYLNSKQRHAKLNESTNIMDIPTSSTPDTSNQLPMVDIENLLQETEEFPDNYTVSYPIQEEEQVQPTIQSPIEEIKSESDPLFEESASYTVKFPKAKTKKLKQQVPSPGLKINTKKTREKKTLKRKFEIQPEESNLKIPKVLEENTEFENTEAPIIEELSFMEELDPSDLNLYPESIEIVPSSSKDVQFNILENPKENLGTFLDNTQIQLGHLQEILNKMDAKEIVNLANCLSDDSSETNDLERSKLNTITQELEELSKLPSDINITESEEENQPSISNKELKNSIQVNDFFTI